MASRTKIDFFSAVLGTIYMTAAISGFEDAHWKIVLNHAIQGFSRKELHPQSNYNGNVDGFVVGSVKRLFDFNIGCLRSLIGLYQITTERI